MKFKICDLIFTKIKIHNNNKYYVVGYYDFGYRISTNKYFDIKTYFSVTEYDIDLEKCKIYNREQKLKRILNES